MKGSVTMLMLPLALTALLLAGCGDEGELVEPAGDVAISGEVR